MLKEAVAEIEALLLLFLRCLSSNIAKFDEFSNQYCLSFVSRYIRIESGFVV